MRYLVGFTCALMLLTSPQSVSAQGGEEGVTPEPNLQEAAPPSELAPKEPVRGVRRWHPEAYVDPSKPTSEPAPEEPALQLKLDAAGVEVTPSPSRTEDGYTLEEMELRVKQAKIGLGISVPFIWIGVTLAVFGIGPMVASEEEEGGSSTALLATGTVMSVGGLGGTIASSVLLRRRKRELRRLEQAHYGIPARTRRGYTLEEAELRVKRARIGLGVSAGILVLGVALMIPSVVGECRATYYYYSTTPRCDALTITSITFMMAGLVGMITTGFLSLRRTRDRDWLRPADYGTPRRVQWDLARSRLVF